ncbi:hypothetical protein JCM10213_004719 [Rhodosporidiobolus nylandii]
MQRYALPSPSHSQYTSSSAASSPALTGSSGASSFGPSSPSVYETLSSEALEQQPQGYFDPRAWRTSSTASYRDSRFGQAESAGQRQQRGYAQDSQQRELRARGSFSGQQGWSAVEPRLQQQSHPHPLRPESLSEQPYPSHGPRPVSSTSSLGSYSGAPHAAVFSPSSSSFSSASYPLSSPSSSAFTRSSPSPGGPTLPSHAASSSTVSLGLSPSSFLPQAAREPPRPSAPIPGEGDWAYSPSPVVSPSLLLSCSTSRGGKETVWRDAQSGRALYISRQFRRGADGRLLSSREAKGGDGLIWPVWHDGMADAATEGEDGAVEYLLLECPSAGAVRRAHLAGESIEPKKLGLITEEVLYLRGGKKVAWKRFVKKGWFGSKEKEGAWKGVGGERYRWVREERKGAYEGEAVLKLLHEKTKELMVAVHEVDGAPTQLILSALVLPSIQPVLFTLIHQQYAMASKKLRDDLRDFEDEEGRAW